MHESESGHFVAERGVRPKASLALRRDHDAARLSGEIELIQKILDSDTGRIIRMYECQCGDRTWEIEWNSARGASSTSPGLPY
jgi:hypothetical protein